MEETLMGETALTAVKCSNCDCDLTDKIRGETSRTACPKCGSASRQYCVTMSKTIKPCITDFKVKEETAGQKQIRLEGFNSDELFRKTSQWNKLEQLVDRAASLYRERMRDEETGEILHFTEEPSSGQGNHGDARKKLH